MLSKSLLSPSSNDTGKLIFCYNSAMKLGKYKHSKTGNFYQVIAIAKNSETNEDFVVYEALYDNPASKLWIRPKKMFLEEVKVEGRIVPRFEFIED